MKKDIIELSYELSDLITNSDFYQDLITLEQKIASDQELQKLEKLFIAAQEALISVEENDDETLKSQARRRLSEVKFQLDVHPLMVEYNQALKSLNSIYDEINRQIFRKFVKQKSCKI